MSILVLGSTNADLVVSADRFPTPGETLLGGRFATHAGGKGANQAVAAARLSSGGGADVRFVTKVGKDGFGESAKAGYAAEGMTTDYVLEDETAATGVALITVAEGGENTIVVASGANATLSVEDVHDASAALLSRSSGFAKTRVALFQLETPLPTVRAGIKLARTSGATVILNPAPAQPLSDELLEQVDVLTPNETEAAALTGVATDTDAGIEAAAEALRSRGVGTVIITLGSRGAFVLAEETRAYVSAPEVNAIDATAAGDCFNGALAVGLSEGLALTAAADFACRAAALSVQRAGAQPSLPRRDEIKQ